MPRTPVAPRLLAALAALALTAAACGGDEEAEPTTTTTEAPESAGDGESEDEDGGEEDDADAGEASGLTADDLLEAVERTKASESADVQVDLAFDGGAQLGSQELELGGDVTFDGTRGDISVGLGGAGGAVRILLADGEAFIGGDLPEVRDALPEGAEWATLPSEQLLASESFSNPGDLAMLYLVGGATDLREDGDVVRFDVDLDAAVASAPEDLRQEVESTISFTGQQAPVITGEVELDDEGRITSLSVVGVQRATDEEIEALSLEEGTEIQVSLDVTLEDFDGPVEIEVPTSGTVPIAEAPELGALIGIEPAG